MITKSLQKHWDYSVLPSYPPEGSFRILAAFGGESPRFHNDVELHGSIRRARCREAGFGVPLLTSSHRVWRISDFTHVPPPTWGFAWISGGQLKRLEPAENKWHAPAEPETRRTAGKGVKRREGHIAHYHGASHHQPTSFDVQESGSHAILCQ